MRNMGIVRGSIESAIPFEICVDTVYLRFNIELVPHTENEGDDDMGVTGEQYQYHEIQYDLREWLQIITESVIDTNSFELNSGLAKDLKVDSGTQTFARAYVGLAEQKPFNFSTKFTPRRNS